MVGEKLGSRSQIISNCIKLTLTCLALTLPLAAYAAPKGAVALPDNGIVQRSSGGKLYICGNIPPWSAGRLVQGYFLPSSVEIAALKKKLKATSDSKKQSVFKAKIKSLKAYLNAGKTLCEQGSDSGGNFDMVGNVTPAGKIAFGIPANFNANVNNGIAAWNQTCNGCHNAFPSSLPIRTFPYISNRITQSPMNFLVPAEVSLETIANIVAFANY